MVNQYHNNATNYHQQHRESDKSKKIDELVQIIEHQNNEIRRLSQEIRILNDRVDHTESKLSVNCSESFTLNEINNLTQTISCLTERVERIESKLSMNYSAPLNYNTTKYSNGYYNPNRNF